MGNPLEKTIQFRFKGVPFSVRKQTKESGRKVAVHEYPGSDIRFVEDLGKMPDIFRLKAFIDGANDWQDKMRRLSKVLDEKTEGVLEFSFGIITVKPQTYTAVINETRVGEVDFDIVFLKQRNNPSPKTARASVETTSGKTEKLLSDVQDDFADKFVPPTVVNNIKSAVYEGIEAVNLIESIAETIESNVSNISSSALIIKNNIDKLVQDPSAYAQQLFDTGLTGDLFDILPIDGSAIQSLIKLTKFGNNLAIDFFSVDNNLTIVPSSDYDIPVYDETTVDRQKMNINRKRLVNDVRLSALGMLCEQAARADYQTDSQINEVKRDIDTAYTAIVLGGDVDSALGNSLDQARLSSLDVLDQKLQLTPNLVTRDIDKTTDILLAYDLYKEQFNNEDDLVVKATEVSDLNGILPTKLDGELLVFEGNV